MSTMLGDDADDGTPKDFNECVGQQQLQAVHEKAREEMTEAIDKAVTDGINRLNLGNLVERLDRRMSTLANTVTTFAKVVTKLTGKVTEVENHVKINEDEIDSSISGNIPQDMVYDANGDVDEAGTWVRRLHRRLQTNTQGMGPQHRQHGNNNRAPEDPYAKTKFTIPSFSGQYDAEGYLDWEMTVEQKFSGHLVPEQHRVRQATSEFMDFAIIWWNSLASDNIHVTWTQLKEAMRDRFVSPYHRELRKKLQCLEQVDKSVQDYYGELEKGLQRYMIVEDDESSVVRFYSGLRRDIEDIVDYKEFNTANQLF
jgi:hypothetical protein